MTAPRALRLVAACAAALMLPACFGAGNPVTPGPATLVLTPTPARVPASGVSTDCRFAGPAKTWFYSLQVLNTGTDPFVVTEWSRLVSKNGSFAPTDAIRLPDSLFYFEEVFGTTTIAGGQTLTGNLCWLSNEPSEFIRYRLTDASATSFDSATIELLP